MNNDKEIHEKKEIANGFNNFFTNVGPNLAKEIKLPKNDVDIFDYLGKKLIKVCF